MPYISIERIITARDYINDNVNKPETFSGLIFFLLSVKNKKLDGRYLEADMAKFCDFADKAFYLKDIQQNYASKTWYALLSSDWLQSVLTFYLKGKKLKVNNLLISLFWYLEYESLDKLVEEFKRNIGNDVFDFLFNYETENIYISPVVCTRADLFAHYSGDSQYTIKFGNTFLAKQASDLSGAPFGQTLYSSQEIKKTISVFDFDFIDKFSLGINRKQYFDLDIGELRLSKPFILLAGISGTGKTRFVREQAKASGSLSETYCLTSVRPDWHEPSDLLGYISHLSGSTKYITTDVLNFIVKAWKRIIDSDLILQIEKIDGYGDRFIVSGNHEQLSRIPPFWLCLDEMNLAPVEQYFADYLSVLETREWIWSEGRFKYTTDPLLKASILNQVENKECLREQLGLAEPKYDEAWNLFLVHGLGIPFNLIVAGTVNMDETTHGFSRKVIDRALSFDFGEFFPADYDHYFESNTQNKTLSYPIFSYVKTSDLPEIDASGEKSIGFLKLINQVLDKTPFKLAYRALNELLLAVVSHKPTTDADLIAVWDDFLMCKVLPRIEGDNDKLMSDRSHESLLQKLCALIQGELFKLAPASHKSNEDGNVIIQREDLYRQLVSGENHQLLVKSRSLEKLRWMQNRLENFGFTSFWP